MTDAADASAPPARVGRLRRTFRRPLEVWEGLGLRARVTGLFAAGALLLSLLMGGLSFYTTSHFLVSDQVNAAITEARAGAATLENSLAHTPPSDIPTLLDTVNSTSGATSILGYGKAHYSTNPLTVSLDNLPAGLRSLVTSGTPASQTFDLGQSPQVAVGIPLPSLHASYFAISTTPSTCWPSRSCWAGW